MTTHPTDTAGNSILVGCKVGFASRKGSRAWITLGTIEKVGVSVYEHNKDRLGAEVKTEGGKFIYKDYGEVLVYQGPHT